MLFLLSFFCPTHTIDQHGLECSRKAGERDIHGEYCLNSIRNMVLKALQSVEGVPKSYAALRDVVLQLADELEFAREASKRFDCASAQNAINGLIDLVIQAASEISRCYGRRKFGESFIFRKGCKLTSQSYLLYGDAITQQ